MTAHGCDHWRDGAGYCGAPTDKVYLTGPRCPAHTPAALAGRAETVPPYPLTLRGMREAAGANPDGTFITANETVVDQRAKASGKRRSNPGDFRAAQAATGVVQ